MEKKIEGMAFHCHHRIFREYVHDYADRVTYIKALKPKSEQELRLRLFQMIPDNRVPSQLLEAGAASYKAWIAHNKARVTRIQAWRVYNRILVFYQGMDTDQKATEDYNKILATEVEAYKVHLRARDTYAKISITWDTTELHKELCPDCPWDGTTIFPKEPK